jgi:hypothetical protein
MMERAGDPGGEDLRAEIVVVVGEHEAPFGRVGAATRCDLWLVDDILRLALEAKRLGGAVRLRRVDPDLRALIELVGLADLLGL